MKFHIPVVKDQIVLIADWTFELRSDSRNIKLHDVIVYTPFAIRHKNGILGMGFPLTVTFPTGTVLKVECLDIRKGDPVFDSINFRIVEFPPNSLLTNKRFWVKLGDVNNIEFDKK